MPLSQRDVEIWMVAAERADSRVRRPGETRIRNPGEERPLSWPERYVPDPDQRKALKLWVWCEAHGHAFYAVCVQRRHPYTTWLRRKNQAAVRIAMLLALEDSLKVTGGLVAAAG